MRPLFVLVCPTYRELEIEREKELERETDDETKLRVYKLDEKRAKSGNGIWADFDVSFVCASRASICFKDSSSTAEFCFVCLDN